MKGLAVRQTWTLAICASILFGLVHILPQTLRSQTLDSEFEQAVEASKAKMNTKYPDLNKPGSDLYEAVIAVKRLVQEKQPDLFKYPRWPEVVVESCVRRIAANLQLYDATDVIKLWEAHLPNASKLDSNYYAVVKQRDDFYAALQSGKFAAEARDQADQLNIPLLNSAQRFDEARALQTKHEQYLQNLADQAVVQNQLRQIDDQQRQISQLTAINAALLRKSRRQDSDLQMIQSDNFNLESDLSRAKSELSRTDWINRNSDLVFGARSGL